jgi:hypothetical protein
MTDELSKQHSKTNDFWQRARRQSPEFLINRWKEFVTDIETDGHTRNWLIDDYWALLETRESIHNIGCDDQVNEVDSRFRALLISTETKHRYKERKSDYDFWNYGYPKNSTGFFLEQIKIHILGQF